MVLVFLVLSLKSAFFSSLEILDPSTFFFGLKTLLTELSPFSGITPRSSLIPEIFLFMPKQLLIEFELYL